MTMLGRRHFVQDVGALGLGLLAGCGRWPGQAPSRVPRIGILSGWSASSPEADVFRQELRELGYVEGRNVALEWRWTHDGEFRDADSIATELVALGVDIVFAPTTFRAQAAKRATASIPIVFTNVSDPVESGLVAGIGRPGGNATGLSDFGGALSGKRLQLLSETVPSAARVGVVWPSWNPANALAWREIQAAAPALAVQLILLELRAADELHGVFEAAVQQQVDGLIVLGGALAIGVPAAALAAERRLPTMYPNTASVYAGGLMSYTPSVPVQLRRAAAYVDKILKGAKPADLPVEQPREFEFVINLKTAQTLGLTIPQHVLLQATEIIQ
jgi:putative tryptophan/tyrosine transport system substrate-binding protein